MVVVVGCTVEGTFEQPLKKMKQTSKHHQRDRCKCCKALLPCFVFASVADAVGVVVVVGFTRGFGKNDIETKTKNVIVFNFSSSEHDHLASGGGVEREMTTAAKVME